jgi:hypothetical protein
MYSFFYIFAQFPIYFIKKKIHAQNHEFVN